jgi:hypothetical protein
MARRVFPYPFLVAALAALGLCGCMPGHHSGPASQSYAAPPPPDHVDGVGAAALRAFWDEATARQLLDDLALRYRTSRSAAKVEPIDTALHIERIRAAAYAALELGPMPAVDSSTFDHLVTLCTARLKTEEISPGVVVDRESTDTDPLGRGNMKLFKWLCRASILPATATEDDAAHEATGLAVERLMRFADECAVLPRKACDEAKPQIAQITSQEPVDPLPLHLRKMLVARSAMPAPTPSPKH